MDTETKQSGQAGQNAGIDSATGNKSAASNSTATGAAPDMMTLLGQTSLPASARGWLSCLRKSGMSLTYSLQKQHIPNMDQAQSAQSGGQTGGQNSGQSQGKNTSSAQGSNQQSTGASDTMTCSGSCSVRYFDLAVGAILVITVCGILRGCRCMKRWF